MKELALFRLQESLKEEAHDFPAADLLPAYYNFVVYNNLA